MPQPISTVGTSQLIHTVQPTHPLVWGASVINSSSTQRSHVVSVWLQKERAATSPHFIATTRLFSFLITEAALSAQFCLVRFFRAIALFYFAMWRRGNSTSGITK